MYLTFEHWMNIQKLNGVGIQHRPVTHKLLVGKVVGGIDVNIQSLYVVTFWVILECLGMCIVCYWLLVWNMHIFSM